MDSLAGEGLQLHNQEQHSSVCSEFLTASADCYDPKPHVLLAAWMRGSHLQSCVHLILSKLPTSGGAQGRELHGSQNISAHRNACNALSYYCMLAAQGQKRYEKRNDGAGRRSVLVCSRAARIMPGTLMPDGTLYLCS